MDLYFRSRGINGDEPEHLVQICPIRFRRKSKVGKVGDTPHRIYGSFRELVDAEQPEARFRAEFFRDRYREGGGEVPGAPTLSPRCAWNVTLGDWGSRIAWTENGFNLEIDSRDSINLNLVAECCELASTVEHDR